MNIHDDESDLDLVDDPQIQQKMAEDPIFRQMIEAYMKMAPEGRRKFLRGMQRIAALPKEIQRELTREQWEHIFESDTHYLLN